MDSSIDTKARKIGRSVICEGDVATGAGGGVVWQYATQMQWG